MGWDIGRQEAAVSLVNRRLIISIGSSKQSVYDFAGELTF